MKFTELDLTNFPDLEWMTLFELRELYLGAEARPQTTVEQALRDLYKRRHDESERLALAEADGTAGQILLDTIRKCDEQLEILEKKVVIGMREGGQNRVWVGVGSRGLDMQEEIIPQRYWAHLKFDFEDGSAYSGEVRFSGLRFLIDGEIPEDHEIFKLIEKAQMLPTPEENATQTQPGPATLMKMGGQGRPTSIQAVRVELERRIAQNAFELKLNQESEYLWNWFKRTYPNDHAPTPKTIRNNLRGEHRRAKALRLLEKAPK